jgi:chromosome segregation ATPase
MVKKLAKAHRSTALNQLASKIATLVHYQAAAGEDPFAKVKEMLSEMIAKLEKEASAEATEKAYCDEEMAKTEKKKGELEEDVDKLSSRIDKAAARSADLKDNIATLQAELAALAKTQAEMDDVRSKSHAAYLVAKSDLTLGLSGVRKALGVLRDYYGSKEDGAAMLQDFGAFMQQPKPPQKFEKATGAGQSIISILEIVESDFATHLSKEETEESDEVSSYEEITQENKVSTASKTEAVKDMTGMVASLDKRIAEMTSDKDSVSTELKAVLEYYAKLRERCIAKPEPYEERKKRRDAEIAGLKQSLAVLENEAAFFQKRQRRGRHAGFMQTGE